MSLAGVENELTLYYRDKSYSWNDLSKKINNFSTDSPCVISAQQRFSTVLNLLHGFINEKVVFPVSSEFIVKDRVINRCILPENSALAIATSGSQVKPKIAIISRKNIISHCQSLTKIISMNTSSVWLNCLPLNHIAGVMIVYRCWFNNASMVLHDDFDVKKVWHDMHHFSVSHLSLVPRMLSRLLEYSQHFEIPKNLKYVIVGGDKISDSLFQRAVSAGWPILISYGMTEATSTIAIGSKPDKLVPLDGFELEITSEDTLKIKGAMVFFGVFYGVFEREGEGESPGLISDSADSNMRPCNSEWFETNDRVRWDGKYLSIQGRNDDMIISAGKNIAPQYIESLLSTAAIDDIAIGKIYSSEWGDTIVALVCGELDEFKIWIKERIQSLYQPRFFVKVEKIPRNLMGKIDRKAVQTLIDENINIAK